MLKKNVSLLLIGLCSLAVFSVNAEIVLDDYTVTASKTKEQLQNIAQKVILIKKDEIERLNTETADQLVMKYLPSHYHKYTGGLTQVSSRGMLSNGDNYQGKVLILINGHRAGTGNLARIPSAAVEKIEIVKGPGSVMYGSSAMGGTINLILNDQDATGKNFVAFSAGSFDYYSASAAFQEQFDNINLSVKAGKEETGDYSTTEYGDVHNSDEEKQFVGLSLSAALSDQSKLSFSSLLVNDEVSSPSWLNWATYTVFNPDATEYNDRDYLLFDLRYDYDISMDSSFSCLIYNTDESSRYYSGFGDVKSSFDDYAASATGIDILYINKDIKGHKIVTGMNFERQERENTAERDNLKTTPYIPDMEYDSTGIYFQDTFSMLENRLLITGGIRYDYFSEKTLMPKGADYTYNFEKEQSFNHISPKISMVYKSLVEGLTFKAQIAEGFRAPRADELSAQYEYSSFGFPMNVLGNPDLDPETGLTYEAAIEYVQEVFSVSLGVFKTDSKDRIQIATDYVQLNGKSWRSWENIDKAELEGVELDIEAYIVKDDSLNLNVFLNSVYNSKYDDKQTGEELKYISDYEVRAGLNISINDWFCQLSAVCTGPQKIDNWDTFPATVEEKGSFCVADLNTHYDINESITLSLTINNLFDRDYEWVRGYVMSERNMKFRVKISY